jgi:hypothetical protein
MAIPSAIGNLWRINYYSLLENVGVKGNSIHSERAKYKRNFTGARGNG